MSKVSYYVNYAVLPFAILIVFPISAWLLWYTGTALGGSLSAFVQMLGAQGVFATLRTIIGPYVFGSATSWAMVLGYSAFQILLMKTIPAGHFKGLYCFLITAILFAVVTFGLGLFPASIIYDEFGYLIGVLNWSSILLCTFLYFKGRFFPSTAEHGTSGNFIFDFYWGTELFPRVWGIDIKTFTNCRFGLTAWALIVIAHAAKQVELGGLSNSMFVAVFLQLVYLTKFFAWEAGYLLTTDIAHDRAGFYICWGCLVWVPSAYTLPTLYLVQHPNALAWPIAAGLLIVGTAAIVITYIADKQKEIARRDGEQCRIWGKPARILRASYVTVTGERKHSVLLASGFWGLSRHFHYIPEWAATLCWTLPAGFNHFLPYFYASFLGILLLHRIGRLERHCAVKYGAVWDEYKRAVPNVLLPL